MSMQEQFEHAAAMIAKADAMLIGAGAGMGVDSGLPDFRGDDGFWRAYPQFRALNLSFVDLANPHWFHDDPSRAWGFYGHRLNLYRDTTPHAGFSMLKRWSEQLPQQGFVFTSNVDGHFQRTGFSEDQLLECHGSIAHLQCSDYCCGKIWSAEGVEFRINSELRAEGQLPLCQHCGAVARPNILMFGDSDWVSQRTDTQWQRYQQWRRSVPERVVVIELGAGLAVPTVRMQCEQIAARGGTLIRINPRDHQVPAGAVSIPCGALQALQGIDWYLQKHWAES